MLAQTPLSLYQCKSLTEFQQILETEKQFNPQLPPAGQLPLLVYLMLEKSRDKINSLLDYGAILEPDDIIALCEMQCNLNIFQYTLEMSNVEIGSEIILNVALDPQLTDFVNILIKYAKKDDLQSMIFELINLDMPNETIAEVLNVCQKNGVDLNSCDQKGNNLLHLVYQKRQFQMAKFITNMIGEQALEVKNFQNFTPLDIKKQQEELMDQEKKIKDAEIEQKRNYHMNKFVQRQESKKQKEQKEKIQKETSEKIAKQAEKQLQVMEKYVPYFIVLLILLVFGLLYFVLQYAIENKKNSNYM